MKVLNRYPLVALRALEGGSDILRAQRTNSA
jgi:hypothetical protein